MTIPNLTFDPLPDNQFKKEITTKTQVYLHHTASSPDPIGVKEWWISNGEAVSTSFIIGGKFSKRKDGRVWKDGEIFQCFSTKYWGWHLGLKAKHLIAGGKSSLDLNRNAIGIEICNWGGLTLKNGKFYTYAGNTIPKADVIELDAPFRGYKFWQKYTPAQIESTKNILLYCNKTWGIDIKYKGDAIFDIDKRALMGENGVWTHCSVRPDKSDIFPQKEMIEMLRSL